MIVDIFSSWINSCEDAGHFYIERSELESNGFAIFGAGFHTCQVVLPALLQAGLRPCCIIDSDSKKHGQFVCGIPVNPSSELRKMQHLPVLLSGGNLKSMISTCMSFGHQRWFVPGAMSHFCWTAGELGVHPSKLLARNDIEDVYGKLADDTSRAIFMAMLKYQCIFEEDLFSHQEKDIYFPYEFSRMIDYKWFIDAGAYNGDTLSVWKEHVSRTCAGSCMYAGFEPSKKSYIELKEYISSHFSQNSNVIAYNMALGEGPDMFCMAGEDTPSAHIVLSNSDERVGSDIQVVALDSMDFENVSCIKADVEGFELALLKGAIKTIEKFRPALMISVYHRAFDVVDIPKFIDKLNLGYKYYFRHHYPTYGDTVCYMIPENWKRTV